MLNKVMLIGRLGADPEVRNTNSGSTVANLRIATTERRKDQDGNWNEQTEWHSVVCFGRTAELVERYLSKGRQVYIEGRLQTRKWQDREGKDRWTTEVVAFTVQFLGSRDGGGGGGGGGGERSGYGGGNRGGSGSYGAAPSGPPAGGGAPDDDIPF